MRILLILALAAGPVLAQQPDMRFDAAHCHTWEGGLGAQGSYTACQPAVVVVQAPPVVQTRIERVEVPAPAATIVQSCPPPAPVAKPPVKRARKPAVRCEPVR